MLAAFFAVAAVGGLAGLCLVAPRAVPSIWGTCAFILTLAAFGAVVLR